MMLNVLNVKAHSLSMGGLGRRDTNTDKVEHRLTLLIPGNNRYFVGIKN